MKKLFNDKKPDKSVNRTYNGGKIIFRNCDYRNKNLICEGLEQFSYPLYEKREEGKTVYINLAPVKYDVKAGFDTPTQINTYDKVVIDDIRELTNEPNYPLPPTVKETFDKEILTDEEFKLIQDWTRRTKLDSVMDIADKDGYGRAVCIDFENDDEELSLVEGFEFFSSAIAYSFEHEGFTKEESKVLYDVFERITGTDFSYLYEQDLERGDIEEPIR